MNRATVKKQRAVIYARISLDKTGEGLGVQRQEAECRALCKSRGWEVVEVCVDNDVSATTSLKRPAYDRALSIIREGEADVWVSWAYDRVMRRVSDLEPFIDHLDKANAQAHFVQAGAIDLSTPAGQFTALMFVGVAKMETQQKSVRQQAANRQRAHAGLRSSGGLRPFGWDEDRVTVHPVEGPALAQAIDEVTHGRSLRSLIDEWNKDPDLTPARGGKWRYSTIRALLMRASSAGLATYRGNVLKDVPAQWEPIVTVAQWEAICAVLSSPERRTTTDNRLKHYLSHAAVCGVCAGPLIVSAVNIRGSHRRIFRCKSGSNHVTRSFDPIEEATTAAILDRLASPDVAELFQPAQKRRPLKALADIDAVRTRMEQVQRDYEQGWIGGPELRLTMDNLSARLREAQAKVTMQAIPGIPERVRKVKPQRVAEVWESLSPVEQRNVANALLSVTVYPRRDAEHGALPYGALIEWKR